MSETETKNSKETIGVVPSDKINSVVGQKLWAEHLKHSEALAQARDQVATSKELVRKALAKNLKQLAGTDFDFQTDHGGRLRIFKVEKKARPSKSVDLTAS